MKPRESIPDALRLSLSGPAAVHQATLAARQFAERAGIGQADSSRLAILVEELVTNLYEHGELAVDDIFGLELLITGSELVLVLTDAGKSFDAGAAAGDRPIPERGGGAGLRLVHAWATDVDYESDRGRNKLSLRLPIAPGRV